LRVSVLRQTNQGAHAALNRGLAVARGEWLTILNSDDYYYPSRLETMLGRAKENGAEFLFSLVDHVDDEGRSLSAAHPEVHKYREACQRRFSLPSIGYTLLEFNIAVTTGNFLFSRALLGRLGGFRPLRLCHDWDFILGAVHETEPLFVDESLMAYRI